MLHYNDVTFNTYYELNIINYLSFCVDVYFLGSYFRVVHYVVSFFMGSWIIDCCVSTEYGSYEYNDSTEFRSRLEALNYILYA